MAQRPRLIVFTYLAKEQESSEQIPILETLLPNWSGQIDLEIVEVLDQLEYSATYGVWFVPTTILLDAAQQVFAINQGVLSAAQLDEQFSGVLAKKHRAAVKVQSEER